MYDCPAPAPECEWVMSRQVFELGSGEQSNRVFKQSHWPQYFFYYVDIEKYKLSGNIPYMKIQQ